MNRHSARQTLQILADPKTGEPAFAVVPVADYDRLVADSEMLADVAAYDAATAADEESFPIELLDRILAGDNRVRIYREHRPRRRICSRPQSAKSKTVAAPALLMPSRVWPAPSMWVSRTWSPAPPTSRKRASRLGLGGENLGQRRHGRQINADGDLRHGHQHGDERDDLSVG